MQNLIEHDNEQFRSDNLQIVDFLIDFNPKNIPEDIKDFVFPSNLAQMTEEEIL